MYFLSYEVFANQNFLLLIVYCFLFLLVRVMVVVVYLLKNDSLSSQKLFLAIKESLPKLLPVSLVNALLIFLILILLTAGLFITDHVGNDILQKLLSVSVLILGIIFLIYIYFVVEFNFYHVIIQNSTVKETLTYSFITARQYFKICLKLYIFSVLFILYFGIISTVEKDISPVSLFIGGIFSSSISILIQLSFTAITCQFIKNNQNL